MLPIFIDDEHLAGDDPRDQPRAPWLGVDEVEPPVLGDSADPDQVSGRGNPHIPEDVARRLKDRSIQRRKDFRWEHEESTEIGRSRRRSGRAVDTHDALMHGIFHFLSPNERVLVGGWLRLRQPYAAGAVLQRGDLTGSQALCGRAEGCAHVRFGTGHECQDPIVHELARDGKLDRIDIVDGSEFVLEQV